MGEGGTIPTDTTPHSRNLNAIIKSFSAFFAHAFGDCCIMYLLPAENVSTATLCCEKLIARLENSTIFHERMTKWSNDKVVKRENEIIENACGYFCLDFTPEYRMRQRKLKRFKTKR
jgi:hypothetical protein